jgi:hypothetical protein
VARAAIAIVVVDVIEVAAMIVARGVTATTVDRVGTVMIADLAATGVTGARAGTAKAAAMTTALRPSSLLRS